MRKVNLVLVVALVLGMVLAVSCGGAAPAPTATVTVTKTAAAATVTAPPVTAPAVTVTVTTTPAPTPAKMTKVKETESIGGTALFFVEVGKQLGFFAKQGIEVEALPMATGAARTAFFTGQADVTGADPTLFYDERKDVKIISSHMNLHFGILVRKDSPYKSLQDLKGKKIATMPPSAASFYQAFRVIMKLENLDPAKDFEMLTSDNAIMIGWLLKGDVEAIFVNEPFVTKTLVSDGDKVRELAWMNDIYKKHTGSDWLYGGQYVLDAFVKKNPEVAKAFSIAWDQVQTYVYGHDDLWKSDIAKNLWKIEDAKTLELLTNRMPGTVAHPPYGPAYKKALVKREQYIADLGMVKQEVVEWLKSIIIFAD